MSEQSAGFESWAVIELFGHQRIAGKVTEQSIGGTSMVRVDVPDTESRPAYTKYFGAGAIYAITPTSETLARIVAKEIGAYAAPVVYNAPEPPRRLAAATATDDDEDDDEDDAGGRPW